MTQHSEAYNQLKKLLAKADIQLDGKRPFDITVNNEKAAIKAILTGSKLALGESYMRGDWDCERIDQLIDRLLQGNLDKEVLKNKKLLLFSLKTRLISSQKSKAFEVGKQHYDAGNDLYEAMLDKRMVYTCGYWKDAKDLDAAQEAKLHLICKKIGLKKGQRVLDIGGGWGSFAKFAAEKYGATVTNITVSKEQIKLADERCKGLPVTNKLMDYRDLNEALFDHIVSIGMFEHVNEPNYNLFMKIVAKHLKDDGVFLLHTIARHSGAGNNEWSLKYIFPNSMLPSLGEIANAANRHFVIEDVHNFGTDYDLTLMEWWKNFEKAWPKLKDQYTKTFYRMWRLYLLSCAGSFRARNIDLYQVVLTKKGIPGGYRAPR